MAEIIDGKTIALELRAALKNEVDILKETRGVTPGLAVVLAGEDPASKVYVKNKGKACEEVGIRSVQHCLPGNVSEERLLGLIRDLNDDSEIHGILVQLPLPKHLDQNAVLEAVSIEKDVDGFHPYNVGMLTLGKPVFEPCTPRGIMVLLDSTGIEIEGKNAVVIGRSNIVGKPAALMLLQRNATVTLCHSKTQDIASLISSSDIVIASIGKPGFVKGDWIKKGAVVIDVGINRLPDGRLTGDVEFLKASTRAGYITPVPGGVGPMTIAMLLENTLDAAERILGK
ncbi:MAG: bifunctional methylenetetrahydrofolate dehydrogenase/methenyltetrahydrofolate cyclohydrolase FolD [Thermodesulfobacteriota bacterium]